MSTEVNTVAPCGPVDRDADENPALVSPSEVLDVELLERITGNEVETFTELFTGFTGGYGESLPGGRVRTTTADVTAALYQRHLSTNGSEDAWSLGIVPLRDDDHVTFGALDLDAKDLRDGEVQAILRRAHERKLPLVFSRSRSGGLHGWLFLTERSDPTVVRQILRYCGQQLGWHEMRRGESKDRGARFFEVFPKQVARADGQLGNWIRLPYPGGEAAQTRRGVWLLPGEPSFAQWLTYATQNRVTPARLQQLALELSPTAPATADSPDAMPARAHPAGAVRQTRLGDDLADLAMLGSPREADVTLSDVAHWLGQLPPELCDEYRTWLDVLMAIHHQYAGTPDEDAAIELAERWSRRSSKYQPGDVRRKWSSFGKTATPSQITIRTLRHLAQESDVVARVLELNRHFAHVLVGGGSILHTPPNGDPDFMETSRLREHYVNITVPKGKKEQPLIDAWLRHPLRRSYNEVVFDPMAAPYCDVPARSGMPGRYDFNLWPGLAIKPSTTGSCDRFLQHLREMVCGGDSELFEWLMQFIAHIVQEPTRLAGTALALRGPQGAGKSLVGEVIGEILGQRLYTKVSRPDQLTGRFNSLHHGKLLIQVEEGFWAGDKGAEGKLKDMITSPTVVIEQKYRDPIVVPNYTRLLFTSNHAWVVPAGFGERRFAVLDVSGERANDREYFRRLRDELYEQGGCARLHDVLMNEVTVDWSLISRPPATAALLEQQLESLDPATRWLYDRLRAGVLPGDVRGEGITSKSSLFEDYERCMRRTRPFAISSEQLGRLLKRHLGSLVEETRPRINGQRQYHYRFAPLHECRAHFGASLAFDPEWPEPHAWQPDDLTQWLQVA